MANEDDFITNLLCFGLTEKEAHCYFHLLEYGPKTASLLAKALHTHGKDMHRTLQSLINKGMVRHSLSSPTVYTAVELEPVLESPLKKRETELREMEARKRELQELSRQQHFRPSYGVSTFKVLKTLKEIAAAALPLFTSTEKEYVWVAPQVGLEFGKAFGTAASQQEIVKKGGLCRGITDITYSTINLVRHEMDSGADVRHFEGYRGMYFGVFDRRYCISAINLNVRHLKPDAPATMLYTDDPVHGDYLASTFEMLWKQAVPAEERIQELLKHGPPKVGLSQY